VFLIYIYIYIISPHFSFIILYSYHIHISLILKIHCRETKIYIFFLISGAAGIFLNIEQNNLYQSEKDKVGCSISVFSSLVLNNKRMSCKKIL